MTRFFLAALLILLETGSLTAGIGPGRTLPPDHYLNRLTRTAKYTPGTVIVKFKTPFKGSLSKNSVNLPSLSAAFSQYGVLRMAQMYPNHAETVTPRGTADLSRMYRIEYTSDSHPIDVAKHLSAFVEIEYAEPEAIHTISAIPNDPSFAQQWALTKINAPAAWDITTGDPNVVVGIVDTGVDWPHEDLRANIWINPGEDVNKDGKYTAADDNKKDDDGNGFIDDIIGIDFAGANNGGGGSYYDNDPQPMTTGNAHGTHVAGIATGVGNNSKGIAGVAYGCKILPVKCTSDLGEGQVSRGFDGIVYAADMGAKVINCSWGGGGYLRSEEERLDYANARGALVVAAAGNSYQEEDFSSPAAYGSVLSVGNSTQEDRREVSSTFGTWVDVSAPGADILSTVSNVNHNGYASWSGTSMASPVAAGVAALVKSRFPNYTPAQVFEQVRVTSENIDAKNPPGLAGLFGYGRVNALRALTLSSPAVRMVKYSLSDQAFGNGNGIIDPGETLQVAIDWKNILQPTTNALVTFSVKSNFVTILKGNFTIGALGTGQTISNAGDPFLIQIKPSIPLNAKLSFVYNIVDGSYKDYNGFSVYAQPTYRDHDQNNVLTTISNDGNVGFDDFTGLRGRGFIFKNNGYNILFEGAFMVGGRVNGAVRVVDQARNETGSSQTEDFVSDKAVIMETPGKVAAQEGFASWTDDAADANNKIGIRVNLHSYEFTEPAERNIVILRYTIKNTSANTITDLHAGLYFDWDISTNATNDKTDFDTTKKTGYAWDISTVNGVPTHVGMTALTRSKKVHWMAIANPDRNQPPAFGVHDGYSKNEKWLSMSNGVYQKTTYVTDISSVIGNGPYQLAPGDSCDVAFALLADTTNQGLLNATDVALDIWNRITKPTAVEQLDTKARDISLDVFPSLITTSQTNTITVQYSIPSAAAVAADIVNALGTVVRTITGDRFDAGTYGARIDVASLPRGIYFVRLHAAGRLVTKKLLIAR